MKKLMAVILAVCCLALFVACSSEDEIHTEWVREYSTGGEYYINTYNQIQVLDFGTRFSMPLYDVIETEGNIQFYYAYEGKEETTSAEGHRKTYSKYLSDNFILDEELYEQNGAERYEIEEGSGKYIRIMPYYMSGGDAAMMVISVPGDESVSTASVFSSDDMEVEYHTKSSNTSD